MRIVILASLLLASTPSFAQVCAPAALDHVSAVVDRGRTLACFSDASDGNRTCIEVTRAGKSTKVAPPRAAPPPTVEIRDGSICVAGKCTKTGPKLAAATTNVASTSLHATSDRAILVVESNTAWNVAADRPLVVKSPDGGKYCGTRFAVAGATLVAHWDRCGQSAAKTPFVPTSVIVDPTGANRGAFPSGSPVELDKQYLAMLPFDHAERASDWDATLSIVDRGTGKAATRTLVKASGAVGAVAKADATTAFLVWNSDERGWNIEWIALAAKDARPTSTARIARCPK